MTPAARAQAAIDILELLAKTDQPADRLLRDFFRARRYAGSKDRARSASGCLRSSATAHRSPGGCRTTRRAPS